MIRCAKCRREVTARSAFVLVERAGCEPDCPKAILCVGCALRVARMEPDEHEWII